MSEASRFGIMNTYEDGTIYEFDEKPKVPKSNKASMGIYVFTWSKLRKYLEDDEADPNSSNDFGKNVLPAMLNAGEKMVAYQFSGYWKDVGTIESLWESNMDLLNPNVPLDLSDENWKIYSRNPAMPPPLCFQHRQGAELPDFRGLQCVWRSGLLRAVCRRVYRPRRRGEGLHYYARVPH